jgi:hypothetical protein
MKPPRLAEIVAGKLGALETAAAAGGASFWGGVPPHPTSITDAKAIRQIRFRIKRFSLLLPHGLVRTTHRGPTILLHRDIENKYAVGSIGIDSASVELRVLNKSVFVICLVLMRTPMALRERSSFKRIGQYWATNHSFAVAGRGSFMMYA